MSRAAEEAERLTDILDIASRTADMLNQRGVEAKRLAAAPEQVPDDDGNYPITECRECGDDLSLARLKTGRTRCVPCVEREEMLNKMRGR